ARARKACPLRAAVVPVSRVPKINADMGTRAERHRKGPTGIGHVLHAPARVFQPGEIRRSRRPGHFSASTARSPAKRKAPAQSRGGKRAAQLIRERPMAGNGGEPPSWILATHCPTSNLRRRAARAPRLRRVSTYRPDG